MTGIDSPLNPQEIPMSAITRQTVEATLRQYQDPYLNQDPVSAGCLREVEIQGRPRGCAWNSTPPGCSGTAWRKPCKWPWRRSTASLAPRSGSTA